MPYSNYLQSTHWKEFKAHYLRQWKKKHPRCEFCREIRMLNLHHKTYVRLGREQFGDVVLICVDCHAEVHAMKEAHPELTLEQATNRVKRIIKPKARRVRDARRGRAHRAWLVENELDALFEHAIEGL